MTRKIDLYHFIYGFKRTDRDHLNAIKYLEENLPEEFLKSDAEWVKIYKGLYTSTKLQHVHFYCSENEDESEDMCFKMCSEYYQTDLLDSELVENFTLDDLKKEVSSNRLVIIYIKNTGLFNNGMYESGEPSGDHPILLIGMENDDDFIFHDPFGNMNFGYTDNPLSGEGIAYCRQVIEKRWTGKARIFKNNPLDNHGHLD